VYISSVFGPYFEPSSMENKQLTGKEELLSLPKLVYPMKGS
jgi:hypothetical protein